ncbi:hypothetical protein GW916_13095 [bacterium]|nr:hypothetical protein [bacterium]
MMTKTLSLIFALSSIVLLSNCSHHKGKSHGKTDHSGECQKCKESEMQPKAAKYLKHVSEGTPIGKLAAPSYKHMSFTAQPSKEDLAEAKKQGYQVIINLRAPSEISWDEAAYAKSLGLEYYNVPLFNKAEEIDAAAVIKLERIHMQTHKQKQLIHCSTGNRAAAWMAAHMMVKHELSAEDALKVGRKLGITKKEIEEKVITFSQKI